MGKTVVATFVLSGAMLLSACERPGETQVNRALQDLDIGGQANLDDVMLTTAEPEEAVSYFTRAAASNPEAIGPQRGLAKSLVRAGRTREALAAWEAVTEHPQSNEDDRVDYAGALIRDNQWDAAEAALDAIPPTHETYQRYRLEAMIADSNEDWAEADTFYEIAAELTTTPASVLNNWGYSKLTRGDYREAERLFVDAIRNDQTLFTAKNNLMLARGAQRNYQLPVIPMDQTERAQLLHTLALAAIKQNDVTIGKGLLNEAIATHPQHFEEAVRSLRALEANVAN